MEDKKKYFFPLPFGERAMATTFLLSPLGRGLG
jgi:hypothetical protein